ncbi:hypothetical protein [Sphingomonas sp. 3-13AW]
MLGDVIVPRSRFDIWMNRQVRVGDPPREQEEAEEEGHAVEDGMCPEQG